MTKYVIFGVRKVLLLLFREKGERVFRKWCFSLEHFLGTHKFFVLFQRSTTSFGGIMKVKKGERADFMAVQIHEFTPILQSVVAEKEPNGMCEEK